jgi:FkbM family methyltransferase
MLLALLDRFPSSWIRAASAIRGRSRIIKSMTDWLPDLIRNGEGHIQRGLGRGLRFNGADSAVSFLLGTHDLEVQFIFRQLLYPGLTVYDIGANVGYTAILAASRVGPNGHVLCFEPLADNARQIRHNAALNNFDRVDVLQVALGNEDGEAEFLVSESPTWGRLSLAGSAPKQKGAIRVPVNKLDTLAATEALPIPHLIKMDVEGAEADVICGGRTFLAASRPVMVIELHHSYQAVLDALSPLAYNAYPLSRTGARISVDGEFQLLAYPRERQDIQVLCAEIAGRKVMLE